MPGQHGVALGLTAVICLACVGCSAEPAQDAEKKATVRRAAVAGAFYPGTADRLTKTVQGYLDAAPQVTAAGEIKAVVAPHAGYVFSGQVAACTHRLLADEEFDTVVIIGHDVGRGAVAFICDVDYFETPLGRVEVDQDMVRRMLAFDRGIRTDQSMHAREHTVEVQLPFLQVLGKLWKTVPILFGNPTLENCRTLADAIDAAAGDKRVLVFASADMTHYPRYADACRIDQSTLEALRDLDAEKFFDHLLKKETDGHVPGLQTAMCSRGGVGTAILYGKAHGADFVQTLQYANSGDVPAGDRNRVVGYGAMVIVEKPNSTGN